MKAVVWERLGALVALGFVGFYVIAVMGTVIGFFLGFGWSLAQGFVL